MAKKNIVQNVVNKSGKFVGSVFSGVGKFAKNVTGSRMLQKTMRRSMRGGKRRGSRKSRSMRKTKKSSCMGMW